MSDYARFTEKASQCRRLARDSTDQQTIVCLSSLADEYEAKALKAKSDGRGSSLGASKPAAVPRP